MDRCEELNLKHVHDDGDNGDDDDDKAYSIIINKHTHYTY